MKLIYQCDFCTTRNIETIIDLHEKECISNPKNKCCLSCFFYPSEFSSDCDNNVIDFITKGYGHNGECLKWKKKL